MTTTVDSNSSTVQVCADLVHEAKTSKRSTLILEIALCIAIIAIQFVFWHRNVIQFLEPYHIVNCDQVAVYLTSYEFVITLHNSGRIPETFLHDLHSHQGPLLPILSILSMLIFGCSRLAGLLVNFLSLITAECLVYVSLRKQTKSFAPALMALGFFLLATTHFFEFGGLNDLRRDYLGISALGLAFLTTTCYLENGGRNRFLLAAASLILLDLSRFVGMIYWISGLSLCFASAYILKKCRRISLDENVVRRLGFILCTAAAVTFIHIVACWDLFNQYYLQMNARGESQLRWSEFGVNSINERLLFYPASFVKHFGVILGCTATILLVSGIALAVQKRMSAVPKLESSSRSWVLAGVLLSSYVILTSHTASPIVSGIFSIPLSVCCALLCTNALSTWIKKPFITALATLISVIGLFVTLWQLALPTRLAHPNERSSLSVRRLTDNVVENVQPRQKVSWLLYQDGLHPPAFLIRWYEKHKKPAPNVEHFQFLPFPVEPLTGVLTHISQSDYVIAPITIPDAKSGWFEYPGIKALREYLPSIKQALNKDFTLVESYPGIVVTGPDEWTIGLFRRN